MTIIYYYYKTHIIMSIINYYNKTIYNDNYILLL
jgi:hypothetical protein